MAPTSSPTTAPPPSGLLRVARVLLRARRPHAAALVLAELARSGNREPEVWCALGAALLGARNRLAVKPYEAWASWVLREAEPIVFMTPFAQPRLELAQEVAPPDHDKPLAAAELDELQDFLLTSDDVLPHGIDGLGPEDRVLAISLLAESSRHAAPVMREAINGRWGDAPGRTALRRSRRFFHRVDVLIAIRSAGASPRRDALEPFLGELLDELGPL
jgi:hypothetical protein